MTFPFNISGRSDENKRDYTAGEIAAMVLTLGIAWFFIRR